MPGNVLTTEQRRKGQKKGAETRQEQGKSFRQKLAEKIDARADEVIELLLDAGRDDWRAITGALDQAFGKPTARLEHTGADGAAIEVEDRSASFADVLKVLREAEVTDLGEA